MSSLHLHPHLLPAMLVRKDPRRRCMLSKLLGGSELLLDLGRGGWRHERTVRVPTVRRGMTEITNSFERCLVTHLIDGLPRVVS